jgi:pantetheine-phosphate adenylyltransferase
MDRPPLVAIYPGTFDPITLGHSDIIRRATRVADKLVIGVANNPGKGPMFGVDERVELVRQEVANLNTNGAEVSVRAFGNLLMNFAEEVDATLIIRGLRAVSDFEYEFQMASMNARLNPHVETVFLTASETNQFISSQLVKEIARLGGDIRSFVSPRVAARIAERLQADC